MTLLDIVASLLVLSALFGILNHRVFGLPHTVGLVAMGIAASLFIVGLEAYVPQLAIAEAVRPVLASIDFRRVLLDGFLSALLFAGAVHVDFSELMEQKLAVGLLSTVGVVISTVLVGFGTYAAAGFLGIELPLIWAFAFGALISPTDPVAVLATLKTVRVPSSLHAKIAAESLLNDGVGVVVFTIVLAEATGSGAGPAATFLEAARLFVVEAIGGAALGLVTGYAAYWLMARLDEHNIEVMITLALVAATYAIAQHLSVSGPIAEVVAGVLIGNQGARFAMSQNSREHVFQFWDLVDELLNSLLFLLIGLELILIGESVSALTLAVMAIPVVVLARLASVALPLGLLGGPGKFSPGAVPILTWAGLRGGLSLALALSLPDGPVKGTILTATYVVVVFTILAQGLTISRLVQRYYPDGA